MNDVEFAYLKKAVLKLLDRDLDLYKGKQMRRRLDAFIDNTHARSVVAYCHELESDPEVLQKLKDFLTINVSEFFRDDQPFTNLKKVILPQLLQNHPRLNIWSAGCSNGAEIYSITMILNQIAPNVSHRLLGTDIDDTILAMAKAGGPYNEREVRNIEKWNMKKHFTISGERYYVVDDIKRRVTFKKNNLMQDPYEKGFDMIVCRNVVIYFGDNARNNLYRKFCESLKEDGVLFVGGSEIIMGASSLGFKNIVPSFYQKSGAKVLARA